MPVSGNLTPPFRSPTILQQPYLEPEQAMAGGAAAPQCSKCTSVFRGSSSEKPTTPTSRNAETLRARHPVARATATYIRTGISISPILERPREKK